MNGPVSDFSVARAAEPALSRWLLLLLIFVAVSALLSATFGILGFPGIWLVGAEIALACLLFLAYHYFRTAPHQVLLDDRRLHLRGLFKKSVPLPDLSVAQLRVVDLNQEKELAPRFKTWGMDMGRLKSGWFRSKRWKKSFVLLADKTNVIYLPTTKGYSLLFSVSSPQEFKDEISRRTGVSFLN